ncbi:MAG: histidine phosphatase family protein [bacterium]|nr:histidine phosphatase family protein [bacterium]
MAENTGKKPTVAFLRHGKTLSNEIPWKRLPADALPPEFPQDTHMPLAEKGREEAKRLGEQLADVLSSLTAQDPSIVIRARTSDFARAEETAELAVGEINARLPAGKRVYICEGEAALQEKRMGVVDPGIVNREPELHAPFDAYRGSDLDHGERVRTVPLPSPTDRQREIAAAYGLREESEITGENVEMVTARLQEWFNNPGLQAELTNPGTITLVFTHSMVIALSPVAIVGKNIDEAAKIFADVARHVPNCSATIFTHSAEGGWQLDHFAVPSDKIPEVLK